MAAEVYARYDDDSGTLTYVVSDTKTKECCVIDAVLDYDVRYSKVSEQCLDECFAYIKENGLKISVILDTHAHADHVSGSFALADRCEREFGYRPRRGIGEHITAVQAVFKDIYHLTDLPIDGSQFDHLFKDGDTFKVGELTFQVLHTPGHTPACVTYYLAGSDGSPGMAFVGDSIFMPDSGTARCDFPGGCSRTLFASVSKILALPPETVVYVCHDYGAGGSRDKKFKTTVAEELAENKHVKAGTTEEDFVEMRTTRDATLSLPRLLIPSIQVNINGGALPDPEEDGGRYLKFPINKFS